MKSLRGSRAWAILALFSTGLCLGVLQSQARPASLISGSALAEQADSIYAFRHVSFRAKGRRPGRSFLHEVLGDRELQGCAAILPGRRPDRGISPGDFAPGAHMEFPRDNITLVYLTKDKGSLRFTSDNPLQISPSFHFEGSLTKFRSLQDLLIYAARQSQSPEIRFACCWASLRPRLRPRPKA